MKKFMSLMAVATVMMVLALPVFAGSKAADPVKGSVSGTLVDTKCFLSMGAKGGDHTQCGASCIQGGAPAGIVDKSGNTTVLVVASSPALAQYAGKESKATGTIFGTGKGRVINVDKLEVEGKMVQLKKGMM